ncbi:MAG: MltA domain-containing protein [Proteobacteria bacterium]|nr:MltA domain-containing protein [Pseudomonadota bacterium]
MQGNENKILNRSIHLSKYRFSKLPGWAQDNHIEALNVFIKSCYAFRKKMPHYPISTLTKIGGLAADWHFVCDKAINSNISSRIEARRFFEKWFFVYNVCSKDSCDGRVTGYCRMHLNGSIKRSKRYKYPVYMLPENLNQYKGDKSLSRSAIEYGSLQGKGLEIAWVDSKARLFFMHIQGSGSIKLKEGGYLHLGYAGQNGFAYNDITPYFAKYRIKGLNSLQSMIEWMDNHPALADLIMRSNQSYVFFKVLPHEEVIGAQSISLTNNRSIAIDYKLYPYGAPIWIDSMLPKIKGCNEKSQYRRLLVAQDTGGAIKSALRADIFFGSDMCAEKIATQTNAAAKFYVLLPKSVKISKYYEAQ